MENPVVNFLKYELVKITFERLDNEADELAISINISEEQNIDDEALRRITLETILSGSISAEIVVAGIFKKAADYPDEFEDSNAMQVIGASILLPYARSIISFISSADGHRPIIIPTVNLNNLYESKIKADEPKT
jgi:preprotein translocase subunit SecB